MRKNKFKLLQSMGAFEVLFFLMAPVPSHAGQAVTVPLNAFVSSGTNFVWPSVDNPVLTLSNFTNNTNYVTPTFSNNGLTATLQSDPSTPSTALVTYTLPFLSLQINFTAQNEQGGSDINPGSVYCYDAVTNNGVNLSNGQSASVTSNPTSNQEASVDCGLNGLSYANVVITSITLTPTADPYPSPTPSPLPTYGFQVPLDGFVSDGTNFVWPSPSDPIVTIFSVDNGDDDQTPVFTSNSITTTLAGNPNTPNTSFIEYNSLDYSVQVNLTVQNVLGGFVECYDANNYSGIIYLANGESGTVISSPVGTSEPSIGCGDDGIYTSTVIINSITLIPPLPSPGPLSSAVLDPSLWSSTGSSPAGSSTLWSYTYPGNNGTASVGFNVVSPVAPTFSSQGVGVDLPPFSGAANLAAAFGFDPGGGSMTMTLTANTTAGLSCLANVDYIYDFVPVTSLPITITTPINTEPGVNTVCQNTGSSDIQLTITNITYNFEGPSPFPSPSPSPSPSLFVDPDLIEITQSVNNFILNGQTNTTLVQGKNTAVIANVSATNVDPGDTSSVTVMAILDDGNWASGTTTIQLASSPGGANVTMLPLFPSSSGASHITITATDPSDAASATPAIKPVQIKQTVSLNIDYFQMSGPNEDVTSSLFANHLSVANSLFNGMYPIPEGGLNWQSGAPFSSSPIASYSSGGDAINHDLGLLALYAAQLTPGSQAGIGIVADNYFVNRGITDGTVGIANMPTGGCQRSYRTRGAIVEEGYYDVTQHELAHTFGLDHQQGAPNVYGYWVDNNQPINSLADLMDTTVAEAPFSSKIPYHWVSQSEYQCFFQSLLSNPADPQVLLIAGFLGQDQSVNLLPTSFLSNGVPTPFNSSSEGSVNLLDSSGNVIAQASFDPTYALETNTGASIPTTSSFFLAQVPASQNVSTIQIQSSGQSVYKSAVALNFVNGAPTGIASPQPLTNGSDCNGLYTGHFSGNIRISADQNCSFTNGSISGNIQMTGGNLNLTGDTIQGNIQIQQGGTFSISGVTMSGNLQIQSLPNVNSLNEVCGSTFYGNIQTQDNATPVLFGSSSQSTCSGNLIDGNLQVTSNSGSTTIYGNTINGNLQDQSNTGMTSVYNNTVHGNLQCQSNSSISGGSNSASQKQGQCSDF